MRTATHTVRSMAPIAPEDGVVAVTGVSGFTGGWVAQELVNAGCELRGDAQFYHMLFRMHS